MVLIYLSFNCVASSTDPIASFLNEDGTSEYFYSATWKDKCKMTKVFYKELYTRNDWIHYTLNFTYAMGDIAFNITHEGPLHHISRPRPDLLLEYASYK